VHGKKGDSSEGRSEGGADGSPPPGIGRTGAQPHAAQYLTIENFDPEAEADDSRPYTIQAGVQGFRVVIGPCATDVMARRAAASLFPARQADEVEPT
jgi:hypothetical protein